ncbi:TA system VapC family ribonuclease toxin [Pelagicoccus sp. SDUM812003]|uniref:TA system VapC family ribonuclease toxin n=1 Tax=Pelagicoccus sp. SDUM812003 TaxID=3041267 RepID=UPI00280CC427|nr:TA system VapC family ribonuclease toxin [Pelagicoccus sp. SDUM812003]MDQ8205638.1 hypothetical protein [Pelagicoccus sp. SDUM812003]
MSRYLLDVNVLLALFDPTHLHHEQCHDWVSRQGSFAWASCPLTENGFARVISNPKYPNIETTPQEALSSLNQFAQSSNHSFWPDSISLRKHDVTKFGPKQLTDTYLVQLASKNDGKLATLDRRLKRAWNNTPHADHVFLIGN